MRRRELLYALGLSGTAGVWSPIKAKAQSTSGPVPSPTGYLRTNWSEDPFARGSYSFLATGSSVEDRETLAEPLQNRVYFAGEATHIPYASTVHAAYESGLLAAEAIEGQDHARIAIIGAGISGLACAQALAGNGKTVTVFEARDRVGGRIWTDQTLGQPLDLGASWIHGLRGNPITALTRDNGISTVRTTDDYVIRGAGGQEIADRQAPDWLTEVSEIQHLFGAESDTIDWDAYEDEEYDYSGGDASFPGGYAQIFDHLNGPFAIELSQKVTAIAYDGGGVTLRSESGKSRSFDAVVVTLPLGVLKAGDVAFDPPLPAEKQHAINRLGFGLLDKVYLKFDRPFWDRDTTWILTPDTGLEPGFFNQWFNLYPSTDEAILCAFNGGEAAHQVAQTGDDALVAMAMQVLERVYGG